MTNKLLEFLSDINSRGDRLYQTNTDDAGYVQHRQPGIVEQKLHVAKDSIKNTVVKVKHYGLKASDTIGKITGFQKNESRPMKEANTVAKTRKRDIEKSEPDICAKLQCVSQNEYDNSEPLQRYQTYTNINRSSRKDDCFEVPKPIRSQYDNLPEIIPLRSSDNFTEEAEDDEKEKDTLEHFCNMELTEKQKQCLQRTQLYDLRNSQQNRRIKFLPINIVKFQKHVKVEDRKGAEKDAVHFSRCFEKHLIDVVDTSQSTKSKNLDGENLDGEVTHMMFTKTINNLKRSSGSKSTDLLIVYLGSHATDGDEILFSCGTTMHYLELAIRFRRIYDVNIPLLFILNFCRSNTRPVKAKKKKKHGEDVYRNEDDSYDPLEHLNVGFFHSTSPRYPTFRHHKLGAPYIKKWIQAWELTMTDNPYHDMDELQRHLIGLYEHMQSEYYDRGYMSTNLLPAYEPYFKKRLKFPISPQLARDPLYSDMFDSSHDVDIKYGMWTLSI